MSSRGCWNNRWPAAGSATDRRSPRVTPSSRSCFRSRPHNADGGMPSGRCGRARPIPPRAPGESNRRRGRCTPRRASIGAMVASKLTMLASKLAINARMPESVRVRVHLRWLGSLPRRFPVNARERFSHASVPTACFHPPPGRRGPARPPGHPPGTLAPHQPRRHRRGALRHFRRLNVLNPSSIRPARIPHRSYPAHAARWTSGWPPPGLPKPAAAPAVRWCAPRLWSRQWPYEGNDPEKMQPAPTRRGARQPAEPRAPSARPVVPGHASSDPRRYFPNRTTSPEASAAPSPAGRVAAYTIFPARTTSTARCATLIFAV